MVTETKINPVITEEDKEVARIVIGNIKELMKGKTIEVRCPANKTLFCKILIDRQLVEYMCRRCTAKWQSLTRKVTVQVYHRFTLKGRLLETVIVERGEERVIQENKEVK